MCVSPAAELRVKAEILVAHVVPADKGHVTVDDNRFAMITKVDLQPRCWTSGVIRVQHGDTGVAQSGGPGLRQFLAAHPVIHHADLHAARGGSNEVIRQAPSKPVVSYDVELHTYAFARAVDHCADGIEGRAAVDQQPDLISAGKGQSPDAFERAQRFLPFKREGASARFGILYAEQVMAFSPCRAIVADFAATEHKEGWNAEPRR